MTGTQPTIQTAKWGMTHFRDCALEFLSSDKQTTELRLYFYAVTLLGWRQLSAQVKKWKGTRTTRIVSAYIGTDHALTDPDALAEMEDDGISVYLVRHYRGVFHPKVMWFVSGKCGTVLAGSNNLTQDGLTNNIEFATLTTLSSPDKRLLSWHDAIHSGSELLKPELLDSYKKEKERFGKARAKAKVAGTFTWSKRTSGTHLAVEPKAADGLGTVTKGDLVLEVMPRETSSEGRQVQIPMDAATRFFGLGANKGDFVQLSLVNKVTNEERKLRFTRNKNSTSRLSIRELEYRSRPCVLLFRKCGRRKIEFEIIRKAIDPARYDELIKMCPQRVSSRRWVIRKEMELRESLRRVVKVKGE